jgi:glutathione S-transferase
MIAQTDGYSQEFYEAINEIKEHVKTINLHLQNKRFLVSNRITVADIALSLMISPLYQSSLDEDFFKKEVPYATNWLESIINHPGYFSRIEYDRDE